MLAVLLEGPVSFVACGEHQKFLAAELIGGGEEFRTGCLHEIQKSHRDRRNGRFTVRRGGRTRTDNVRQGYRYILRQWLWRAAST